MPRYHYNVYDGINIIDHDGIELQDLNQARVEALRYAAGIIHDEARKKRLGNEWRLEVTDEGGHPLPTRSSDNGLSLRDRGNCNQRRVGLDGLSEPSHREIDERRCPLCRLPIYGLSHPSSPALRGFVMKPTILH